MAFNAYSFKRWLRMQPARPIIAVVLVIMIALVIGIRAGFVSNPK